MLVFIKETDICNFADGTILYACGKDLDIISNMLKLERKTVTKWFKDNEMLLIHRIFNLCSFESTKTSKRRKKMFFDEKTIKPSYAVELL